MERTRTPQQLRAALQSERTAAVAGVPPSAVGAKIFLLLGRQSRGAAFVVLALAGHPRRPLL
jgi:branched-subunit amino acid ABC-type transport system permease component